MSTNPHVELLQSLRAQVRTLKRVVYTLCCLFVAGGVILVIRLQGEPDVSESVADVVQARKFEVVTEEGKVVVVMDSVSTQQQGVPNFTVGVVNTFDSNGGSLVRVSASKTTGGGVVRTQNGNGGTLVRLAATMDGDGLVETQNGSGGTLVELGATVNGTGLVTTENGNGRVTSQSP